MEINYLYETKEIAQRIANKRNKESGKKVWVVIPEDDEFVVVHIGELIREEVIK